MHGVALRPTRRPVRQLRKTEGPGFGNMPETSPPRYARENIECFGGHGGVIMTTNLATFVCIGKSEKLQKHTLQS